MNRPKFLLKPRPSSDLVLQITSLADILIILLAFLLKSYASGTLSVGPSAGVRLPQAIADDSRTEAVKVEISETAVQVDDQPVSELTKYRFGGGDLLPGTAVARSLDHALELARQRQNLIAQSNPEVRSEDKILVLADQRTPYVTVKTVALTAAVHGFNDLKLVVVKK